MSEKGGTGMCDECAIGSYADAPGMLKCTACKSTLQTAAAGAKSSGDCNRCPDGEYFNQLAQEEGCTACAFGYETGGAGANVMADCKMSTMIIIVIVLICLIAVVACGVCVFCLVKTNNAQLAQQYKEAEATKQAEAISVTPVPPPPPPPAAAPAKEEENPQVNQQVNNMPEPPPQPAVVEPSQAELSAAQCPAGYESV